MSNNIAIPNIGDDGIFSKDFLGFEIPARYLGRDQSMPERHWFVVIGPTSSQRYLLTKGSMIGWNYLPANVISSFDDSARFIYAEEMGGPQDNELRFWSQNGSAKCSTANANKHSGGCNCVHCHEHNAYAEPNMADGKFICYSCKSSHGWMYR